MMPTLAALPTAVREQAWRVVRIAVPYDKPDFPPDAPNRRAFAFQGTGFLLLHGLIRPLGYVVTCAHVLHHLRDRFGPEAPLRAVLGSGHARPLLPLDVDDLHDLALLQLSGALAGRKDAPPTLPERLAGRTVYALGYAEADPGTLWTATGAIVQRGRFSAGLAGVLPTERDEALSVPALIVEGLQPVAGVSGSPVFDAEGVILGYLKGSMTDGRALVLSIGRVWDMLGALP